MDKEKVRVGQETNMSLFQKVNFQGKKVFGEFFDHSVNFCGLILI